MDDPSFWYEQIYGERYKRAEDATVPVTEDWWTGLKAASPLPPDWRPPSYRIAGSGSWPDWMAFWVPLWSERAVDTLGPLVADTCQLIPWVDEPRRKYWLVNVLALVPEAQWTCEQSSAYGTTYASADGIRIFASSIPHMFRLEGYGGKTFVSDELAKLSVASRLRGVAFVHPLIHWAQSVFMPYRFGRDGTGFVRPSPETRLTGLH